MHSVQVMTIPTGNIAYAVYTGHTTHAGNLKQVYHTNNVNQINQASKSTYTCWGLSKTCFLLAVFDNLLRKYKETNHIIIKHRCFMTICIKIRI